MKRKIFSILAILFLFSMGVSFAQSSATGTGRKKVVPVYVTINSNVRGSNVVIGRYRGRTPFRVRMEPGRYSIMVSAPGYNTFRGKVTILRGRKTQYVNISLTPLLVRVRINVTNAERARVYVDGRYKGHTPVLVKLKPGMHSVRIEAEGFMSLSTNINVRRSKREERYNFTLTPMNARLDILVPSKYLNRRMKDAIRLIRVYVDKRLINKKGKIRGLQIKPGRHRVKIVSGGLSVEGDFNFEAGRVYNVELYMKLRLGSRDKR